MGKLTLYECDPSRNVECPAHDRCDGHYFKNCNDIKCNEKYLECNGTTNIDGAKLDDFGNPIIENIIET